MRCVQVKEDDAHEENGRHAEAQLGHEKYPLDLVCPGYEASGIGAQVTQERDVSHPDGGNGDPPRQEEVGPEFPADNT